MDDNDGEGFTDLNGEDSGGIERFPNGGTSAFGRVCLPFNQILLVLHSNCSLIAINDTHACFHSEAGVVVVKAARRALLGGGGGGQS